MAKKYSKYNVYQGCTNMCSYKEALEAINSGKVNADTLHGLEARIVLYQRLFAGIGNTQEDADEFQKKRNNILSSLSEDEKKKYQEKLNKKITEQYDEASKEYLNRINGIDPKLTDGEEDEAVAFDRKKAEEAYKKESKKTRFQKLTNLPIAVEYRCNDDGVYIYDKKQYDYIRVCDAISIRSLNYDENTAKQFIEIEYYNSNKNGTVTTACIPAEEISQGKYAMLIGRGIIIDEPRLFTKYINDLRSIGIKQGAITHRNAALNYGFLIDDEGDLDFNKFVGVDEDCKILPITGYEAYDKVIFKQKGTAEGFKELLAEISKGKYEIDFQFTVAASLSGIVQAYISEKSNLIAPATYLFIGRTSIGKGVLGSLANAIWAGIDKNSLATTSDISAAFAAAFKQRLGWLPMIVLDIQDLMNKGEDGLKGVIDIFFNHSNGISSSRATTSGEVRGNRKEWYNPLIAYNENDCFTQNNRITGGASARITVINLNVSPEDKWITEKDPNTYWAMEKKQYGTMGPAFVKAMRTKKQDDIIDRFYEITAELKEMGVQEKQANALAMLALTDELAREFGLVPARWNALDAKRIIDWIGVKAIPDVSMEMYRLISEVAFKDVSYVPNDDKYFAEAIKQGRTQQDIFDARAKEAKEIRGRILYQKKNSKGEFVEGTCKDHDRALLLIPSLQLNQMINHLEKTSGIVGFNFDQRAWAMNGWLIPAKNGGYVHRDAFKISVTRERNSKNRECYYAIVLYEDGDEEMQTFDEQNVADVVFNEEAAIEYEKECLATMKASLSIDADVNREICKGCTDSKCIYVKRKDA